MIKYFSGERYLGDLECPLGSPEFVILLGHVKKMTWNTPQPQQPITVVQTFLNTSKRVQVYASHFNVYIKRI